MNVTVPSEHGLVTGHVFLKLDFVLCLSVSVLLHGLFFYFWDASHRVEPLASLSPQRGTQIQVQVIGADLDPGQSAQNPARAPAIRTAIPTESLAAASADVVTPVPPSLSESEVEAKGAEPLPSKPEMPDQPIPGLAMGSMARLDLGGSRRKLFSTLSIQAEGASAALAPSQGLSPAIRYVAQAVLSDLTEDLNRKFPKPSAGSCRFSQQPDCSPPDEELQQFLLYRYPVVAQALGGRSVWLTAEHGSWQARLEP